MKTKIKVENLIKIFGNKPGAALKKIQEGHTKAQILEETGQTIGVNGVSFEVKEGEMFVIMGLSGSGKSTLIRCLNLLNKPTSGNIFVDDENIVKYDKKEVREFRKKKMAMVFQHFGLFTHRTVLSNVEYGMEVKGMPKEERQKIAMDMIHTVGLTGYENQYPNELSGGMQQRVGLARALANDPDILLMDEPFSALDPLIRREMQLELISIQSKLQKTIIFITHDINEAFRLGDRVAVMKEGKIVQTGTPEEILTEPSDEYIEDFVKDIDRTKVMQAKNIMWKSTALGFLKDGPNVALKEMKASALSSLFIVDKDFKLHGIVNVDDTIEAIKEKKKLVDILKHDYLTTTPDTFLQELLPMAAETKYPIAVLDEDSKLLGIIVRSTILSGLISGNNNGNGDNYENSDS